MRDDINIAETNTQAIGIGTQFGWLNIVWFGGVTLINFVVWQTLGLIYVGPFLIAYFFIFALVLNRQLNEKFPPRSSRLYRDKNAILSANWQDSPLGQEARNYRDLCLGGFGLFYLAAGVTPLEWKAIVGMLLPVAIVNFIFIIWYRKLFTVLNGDSFLYRTGAYHANKYLEVAEYWFDGLARLRPAGIIIAVVLVFAGAVWLHVASGYDPAQDNITTAGALIVPIAISYVLLEFCYVALVSVSKYRQ